MKVRICFTESGTGEYETIDAEIAEMTGEAIVDAIHKYETTCCDDCDRIELSLVSFVIQGNNAAFIATAHDRVWFGDMLWSGIVYGM